MDKFPCEGFTFSGVEQNFQKKVLQESKFPVKMFCQNNFLQNEILLTDLPTVPDTPQVQFR